MSTVLILYRSLRENNLKYYHFGPEKIKDAFALYTISCFVIIFSKLLQALTKRGVVFTCDHSIRLWYRQFDCANTIPESKVVKDVHLQSTSENLGKTVREIFQQYQAMFREYTGWKNPINEFHMNLVNVMFEFLKSVRYCIC